MKTDIDAILQCGISDGIIELMQISTNRKPKSFNVNVISEGERLGVSIVADVFIKANAAVHKDGQMDFGNIDD